MLQLICPASSHPYLVLPLPSRPERVPAPPASQPFNLVSPICMTGTKTYDLAGRTQMERPGCVFSVSRVINFPLWSPLDYGSIILGRELLNIINTQHSSATTTTTATDITRSNICQNNKIGENNKSNINRPVLKNFLNYVVPFVYLLSSPFPASMKQIHHHGKYQHFTLAWSIVLFFWLRLPQIPRPLSRLHSLLTTVESRSPSPRRDVALTPEQ